MVLTYGASGGGGLVAIGHIVDWFIGHLSLTLCFHSTKYEVRGALKCGHFIVFKLLGFTAIIIFKFSIFRRVVF